MATGTNVRRTLRPGDFVLRRDVPEQEWRGIVVDVDDVDARVEAFDQAAGWGDRKIEIIAVADLERAAEREASRS